MIKKVMLMGLVMTMLTATAVFAEDVYATHNGKKYHKESCRLIKNKKPQKIDKAEAIKKGLTPCNSCFKQEQALANPNSETKKLN